ncbi:MAG: WG repeat-containing protein, partial [Oscillospiraceae bacterium]|nr:WG repeat-containing protein [Oscillospiraceae bacterium]
MKNLKKALSLLLAITMLLTMLPTIFVATAAKFVGEVVIPAMYNYEQVYNVFDRPDLVISAKGNNVEPDSLIRGFWGDLWHVTVNGKYGLMNQSGDFVVQPIYDSISNIDNGFITVGIDGKYGLIDQAGMIKLPIEYDYIESSNEPKNVRKVLKNWKSGLIDQTGSLILPAEYDWTSDFVNGTAIVSKGNQYGLIDATGAFVIVIGKYNGISRIDNGQLFVNDGGTYKIVTDRDVHVRTFAYDMVESFGKGLLRVRDGTTWKIGVVDYGDNLILEIEHDWIYTCSVSDDRAIVRNGGIYSLINLSGTEIKQLSFDFYSANDFQGGVAFVSYNGTYNLLRASDGELVFPAKWYDQIQILAHGLAVVTDGDKTGLIDSSSGSFVLPLSYYQRLYSSSDDYDLLWIEKDNGDVLFVNLITKAVFDLSSYDYASSFRDGLVNVEKDGKMGVVDNTGAVVIPLEYDSFQGFYYDGLACVKKDGKWGFINKSNTAVVPIIYDYVGWFNDGIVLVIKDGKKGFVDETGSVVIPLVYDDLGGFYESELSLAQKDGKWGFINKSNIAVIPFIYDEADSFFGGIAPVKQNDKWRYIDTSGTVVIEVAQNYDWVSGYYDYNFYGYGDGNDHARVWKNDKTGLIDKTGAEILAPAYDELVGYSSTHSYMWFLQNDKWGILQLKPAGTDSLDPSPAPPSPPKPPPNRPDYQP